MVRLKDVIYGIIDCFPYLQLLIINQVTLITIENHSGTIVTKTIYHQWACRWLIVKRGNGEKHFGLRDKKNIRKLKRKKKKRRNEWLERRIKKGQNIGEKKWKKKKRKEREKEEMAMS